MKNEKGITLVALVGLVAVLVILAGVTLGELGRNKKETKSDVAKSELMMVQNAVLQRKTQGNLTSADYEELPGKNISKSEVQGIAKDVTLSGNDGEYKLLEKDDLEQLGITNTKDSYIVNYNTGEVLNKTRYNEFDEPLYVTSTVLD